MVSGTNDRYLQPDVALPLIYEKMEPNLIWAGMTRQIKDETNAFMYQYDSAGRSGDSKKKTPPKFVVGAELPELDRSRRSTTSALLETNGFAMRIPRNVIRSEAGKSEIMEDYEYAGFWMAEWINTNILASLVAGATASTTAPTTTWDSATATPVSDLIGFESDMDIEGYPFRMTDAFTNKTCWYELVEYLTAIDVTDDKQKTLYGIPQIGKDVIEVPVVGASVHKVMSGMTDGDILMLDRNNPAAETHYYVDTAFSQATVSYTTVVDRTPQDVTVPNVGIHFYQYEEDNSHDTILQFWVENKTVVTKPLGLLLDQAI